MISVSRVASLPDGGTSARVVAALSSRTRRAWPPAAAALAAPLGAVTLTGTAAGPAPRVLTLAAGRSLTDDYYHRVHLRPAQVDLGNLISAATRAVEIWSAHFTPQALASITATGIEGLDASGVTAPGTFAALEARTFTVSVSTTGPATIDARYVFTFALDTVALTVIGRRVVVWSLRPDWREPVREGLEWLTEVIEAWDGSEQRIRLREAPRRSWAFRVLAEGRDARLLAALLWGWQARVYCLPVWTDRQDLTAPVAAGATVLTLPTTGYDYHAGGLALLWTSARTHEAVEIAALDAGSLTLARPLAADWPAGTRVYPARLARLGEQQALEQITGRLAAAALRFDVEDVDAPAAADPGPVYLGYPVLSAPPETSEAPSEEYRRALAVLDHLTGRPLVEDRTGYPAVLQGYRWKLRGRAAIAAHRAWCAARAGRLAPCWVARWQQDAVQTRPLLGTAVDLHVAADGYRTLVAAHPARRHVLIRHRDGTRWYRRIVEAVAVDDDEEAWVLDSPLGVTIQPGDLSVITYLHLSRLDADAVELAWRGLDRVEASATFRALALPA